MTSRGVVMGVFPSLRCPYCQSANVAADGEYVCRDCGTVIGPVLAPPLLKEAPPPPQKYRLIMAALEQVDKKSVRRRYSEVVKMHLDKVAKALGAEVAVAALETFKRLDKRVYQSRSPRVVAATLAYLAAERLGIYVHKSVVAEILKVSKFTIKDTAWRLRQYLQKEAEAEKALHSGGYDLRLCSGVRKVGGGGRGEDCAVDATFENDAFFVPFL